MQRLGVFVIVQRRFDQSLHSNYAGNPQAVGSPPSRN